MSLWHRLRNLERAAEGETIVIPQLDGTVKRYPQTAGMDAFINLMDRMGAGEDAPLEHPLIAAARNSSEPPGDRIPFTPAARVGRTRWRTSTSSRL